VIILNFDEDFDEDLDEDLESEDYEQDNIESKIPSRESKKITIYFMSTIGPGEKKQKLNVNDGNLISDIKETVGNLFALNPLDFHLSYGGITMDESNQLSEYNVADGEDILLIPASIAGKSLF